MNLLNSFLRPVLRGKTAGLLAGLLLLASAGRADSFYTYTLDTTGLTGLDGVLAFDLIDGDGVNNNLVTITGLSSDGSFVDASTVSLADTGFFNEVLRDLTFGSYLSFNLQLTENFAPGGFFDQFSFFLLDPLSYLPLYGTSDPTGADALFAVDIDGNAGGIPSVFSGNLTASAPAVPDSGATLALVIGAFGLLGLARKAGARRPAA